MVGIDLGVDTPTGLAADGFVYQTVDVLDADAVGDAVAAVVAVNGRLDDVVHAAGVAGGGPVHVLPDDEWDRVVGVNLKGTFVVARAALAKMVQQQRADGERVHRDADVRFGDGHARFEGAARGLAPRAQAATLRPRRRDRLRGGVSPVSDASFVSGQAIAVDGGYTAGRDHGVNELMVLGEQ